MKFGIPAETRSQEKRVAASPETIKKLTAAGHHTVLVQSGAGLAAKGRAVRLVWKRQHNYPVGPGGAAAEEEEEG